MANLALLLRAAPLALLCATLIAPPASGQSRREVRREAAREEARRIAEREEALSVKGSDWLRAKREVAASEQTLKKSQTQLAAAEKKLKQAQKDASKAEAQIRAATDARLKAEKAIADSRSRMQRAEAEYEARREVEADQNEPRQL